ncbi:MAG TPA: MAPEG family protein [Rhizomicrobium sp.]|nr:MAPEG family protein [Rhizomicrobium sp.]
MTFSNPIAIQIAGLSTELTMLAVAIVLGMFQLLIAARTGNSQRGLKWNVGPRDAPAPPVSKVAGRLERAFRNFLETFPFFAAAVLIAAAAGRHNWATVWGAEIYVAARIVYLPLYGFGVPGLRTLVWIVATLAILLITAALFWPNI